MEMVLIGNLSNSKNKKLMCFRKAKQSKVLTAKKDIVVYKIGEFADEDAFVPYYVNNYTYKTGIQCQTCPDFKDDIIVIGFHGYINIRVSGRLYPHMISVYKNTKKKPQIDVYLTYGKSLYLGKFIIPKGAIYCINELNGIVSNKMIYTGQYASVRDISDINLKELWKEN